MRRADKEIKSRAEIEGILERGRVCHLGLCDNGIPYVVPVNYGYADGVLFIHSARQGRKIEILRRNNLVSFNVYIDECLVESDTPCSWTMKYCSAMGTGKAVLIEEGAEKEQALGTILKHYSGPLTAINTASIDKVLIIMVKIETLTGKRSC